MSGGLASTGKQRGTTMISGMRAWAGVVAVVLATGVATAAGSDANGTWTWSYTTPNGQTNTTTLKLKQDGETLTGTVSRRIGADAEIKGGKIEKDEVSFEVVSERNGQTMTQKYRGKLDGDTIKGKVEVEFNGQNRSRDWEAKRS